MMRKIILALLLVAVTGLQADETGLDHHKSKSKKYNGSDNNKADVVNNPYGRKATYYSYGSCDSDTSEGHR